MDPNQPNQDQQQLPFDAAALAKQVTEAAVAAATEVAERRATETASKKLQQAADVLTGKPAVDPKDQLVQSFVTDPMKFAKTLSEATEDRIIKRLNNQKDSEEQQRQIVMPFVEQYPELRSPTKIALIEKLAEKNEKSGVPYSEALKMACEETVKDYGLKPISEAQRNQAALYAGLPGGGGMGSGAPARNEEKLQTDFISGMKEKTLSFRNRK